MTKLLPLLRKLSAWIALPFLALSLFYAIQSDTLDALGLSGEGVAISWLLMLGLLLRLLKKRRLQPLMTLLITYQVWIFWGIWFFFLIYQLAIAKHYTAAPIYDAGAIISGLQNPEQFSNYLSNYSNNRFYFFFNYHLASLIGYEFKAFQYFNIGLTSTAALLMKLVGRTFWDHPGAGTLSSLIFMLFVAFQPLFLVPYTDTYCLVPLLICFFSLIFGFKRDDLPTRLGLGLLAGITFMVTYLLRPSAIIFIIALGLVSLLYLYDHELRKYLLLVALPFFIGSASVYTAFNYYVDHQEVVAINHEIELPMSHFLLMGSWGDENVDDALHGTWNQEDYDLTFSQTSQAEMVRADLAKFVERTQARGLWGTLKFYLQKFRDNIDTGVIGYHRDGLWLNDEGETGGYHHVFGQEGKYRPIFNLICQLFWLPTLVAMLYALLKQGGWQVSVLGLTIFGSLLFLLVFEAGGTKYLLQFMPFICLLASIGIIKLFEKKKRRADKK